jgi:hypothetical protein
VGDARDDQRNHPQFGIEFDCLAVDPENRVALLSSAGYGPVPKAVLAHVGEVDNAVETILRWPSRGEFVSEADVTGDCTDWFEIAARGLYAYDFRVWDGPYNA